MSPSANRNKFQSWLKEAEKWEVGGTGPVHHNMWSGVAGYQETVLVGVVKLGGGNEGP